MRSLEKKKMRQLATKENSGFRQRGRNTIFYRRIDSCIIQDKKMMIPENFLEKCGGELSPVVTFKVVNGRYWRVGLEKEDNRLWFHQGWFEFIEHHSINVGYFLVFSYERNSEFSVYIFDLKEGKLKTRFIGSEGINQQNNCPETCIDTEEDSSVDILDSSLFPSACNSLRNDVIDRCVDKVVSATIPDEKAGLESMNPSGNNSISEYKNFESNCIMKKRKRNLEMADQRGRVGLKLVKSRRTTASYVSYLSGSTRHIHKPKSMKSLVDQHKASPQSAGHCDIAVEMNSALDNEREDQSGFQAAPDQERQLSNFEPSKSTGIAMIKKTEVDRESDHSQKKVRNEGKGDESKKPICEPQRIERSSMESSQENNRDLHAATKNIPTRPCFQIIMMPFYKRRGPVIPEHFVEKCGDELSPVLILKVVNGRFWHVGLKKEGNKIWFDWGWLEFIQHHSIQVGSYLVFSYEGNSRFSVYINDLNDDMLKTSFTGPEVNNPKNNDPVACINLEEDSSVEILDSSPSSPSASRNDVDHCVYIPVSAVNTDVKLLNITEIQDRGSRSMKHSPNSSISDCKKFVPNCTMKKRKRNLEIADLGGRTECGGLKLVKSRRTNVSYVSCLRGSTRHIPKAKSMKSLVDQVVASAQSPGIALRKKKSACDNERDYKLLKKPSDMHSRLQAAQGKETQLSDHEPSKSICTDMIKETEVKIKSADNQKKVSRGRKRDERKSQICEPQRIERSYISRSEANNRALHEAIKYIPSHPYFHIIITPSSTIKGPHIPTYFVRKYLEGRSLIRVEDSSGTSFVLGCN